MVLEGFFYARPWYGGHCLDLLGIFLVLAREVPVPGNSRGQRQIGKIGRSPYWGRLPILCLQWGSGMVGEDGIEQMIPQRNG